MKLFTLLRNPVSSFSKPQGKAETRPNFWLTFFLIFFVGIFGTNAQETVTDIFNLPPPARCVSNDLQVVGASLDFDLCGPEECQDVKYYDLILAIDNTTGSMRTSFAFYARLEQYNPDGTLANTYFVSGCKGPVPPNVITSLTFDESLEVLDENGDPTNFPGIPYLCGGSLKLFNLYEAWTDASDNDNRQCPLDASKIAPKCDVLPSIEIKTPISAYVEDTSDVSCFGGSDGAIDITVNGGEAPYTYVWSKTGGGFSASTEDVSNLSAGTYKVTITDSNGCPFSLEGIVIGSVDILDADVAATNVTCFEGSDGSITITNPSGGHGSYEYSIDAGMSWQSSGSFTGLSADTYEVYIRDADYTDCYIDLGDKIITEPAILDADVASTNVTCFGDADGTITFSNPSGGSGSYEYSVDGGSSWQSGASFTDLAPDTYETYIRDANATACYIDLGDVIITQPAELVATVALVTDATCAGFANGAIDINVTGGTTPYTYLWSNDATTQDLSGITAGMYSVTVTDANGCQDVLTDIEVDDPSNLEVVATTVTAVSCYGFEDGAIDITVTGGTSPYTYLWSNDATTEDVSGLDAGTYWVKVTDHNGCEYTLSDIMVGEPDQVPTPQVQVAAADCFPTAGSFSIIDASSDYQYKLDDGDWFTYTGTITDVSSGAHTLVAKNSDGCESEPLNFDVPQPYEVPAAPTVSEVQPDCETLTGAILVTSGTTGFLFSLNGADFIAYPMGGFTGLAPGDYQLRVKSNDGCISDVTYVTLEEPMCEEFEGCTLGYWKNHTNRWCSDYSTCDLYGEIFNGAPSALASKTLLEVLNMGGGGIYNLGRQSVAALLNACSEQVNFELATPADVIAYVIANWANAGAAGSYLDMLNNAGECPLGGSSATTAPSADCPSSSSLSADSGAAAGFTVAPVPFRDNLSLKYNFDYTSDVVIEIFNLSGNKVFKMTEKGVSAGSMTSINSSFARGQQLYIIRVSTDRDTFEQKVLSGK